MKLTIIFTNGNATRSSSNPMTAEISVVFAFFIFSSSPYDVVYCIQENTIAPIAKRAPNAITFFDISTI